MKTRIALAAAIVAFAAAAANAETLRLTCAVEKVTTGNGVYSPRGRSLAMEIGPKGAVVEGRAPIPGTLSPEGISVFSSDGFSLMLDRRDGSFAYGRLDIAALQDGHCAVAKGF